MLKPKEVSERLGVSVKTLQRWDNEGVFKAYRTPTNRRYYTEEQIREYLGESITERKTIAYARVSNKGQSDDLDNQLEFIKTHTNANGVIVDEYISDIGSGLNYKRKKWNKLIDEVMDNRVDTIYITYKDRFIRFGYDWFESLCRKFNTKIVVLNDKKHLQKKNWSRTWCQSSTCSAVEFMDCENIRIK